MGMNNETLWEKLQLVVDSVRTTLDNDYLNWKTSPGYKEGARYVLSIITLVLEEYEPPTTT